MHQQVCVYMANCRRKIQQDVIRIDKGCGSPDLMKQHAKAVCSEALCRHVMCGNLSRQECLNLLELLACRDKEKLFLVWRIPWTLRTILYREWVWYEKRFGRGFTESP